jgi:hypothetical protein
MTFTFQPTEKDYVSALRAFALRDARTLIALGGFVILNLGMAAIFSGPVRWIFAALALVFPFIVFVMNPWQVARQVLKHERLRAETTWQVHEDGVTISTAFAENRMDWGTFQRVVETNAYFMLLYTVNRRAFQLLPKRAFAAPEQEQSFRELLAARVGRVP